MIIVPFPYLQSHVVNIMGLKPWAFILIVFIVLLGLMIIFTTMVDSRKQMQNRKKTTMPDGITRKVLGVFVTANRDAYEVLCNVDMHEVYPDPKNKKVKAIGTIAGSGVGVGQHRIPQYYILPNFCFKTSWPKNAKKSQQVDIMETFFRENFSLPALSFEEMTSDERVKVTALMNQMSADQNIADAQLAEEQGRNVAFMKAIAKLNSLKYVNYILIAIAAVSVFTLFYAFGAANAANAIRKFMGIP